MLHTIALAAEAAITHAVLSHAPTLLVLLAAALHATWNALLRGGADRARSMAIMSLAMAAISLLTLPLVGLPTARSVPYVLISGALHIVYSLALVRAYETGEFGDTYPTARGSSPILVLLGAFVFTGERLSFLAVTGVLLVSGGILSIALRPGVVARANIASAFFVGCLIAAYTIVDGLGVRASEGHATTYAAWMFLSYGFVPLTLIASLRCRRQAAATPRETMTAVAGGLISVAAYGIVIWAMQQAAMGAVSALRETSVLFAALLGRLWLGEPLTTRRVAACCAIAAGAALLGSH